jgi:hypothetical protein
VSLEVTLATLAEGVAADARQSLTLVAVNPHALIAAQLPAQFAPVFVATLDEGDEGDPVLLPDRTMSARVTVTGPDGEALFVTEMRQPIPEAPPQLRPRMQIIAQVPFVASKVGVYTAGAHVTVVDGQREIKGEVTVTRQVRVVDSATIAQRPA